MWHIDPRKTSAYFSILGGDSFQGSSKLPTSRQLVDTWTEGDHLETGSWLTLLELSSPPQQPFWVKNSSKHTHSWPGYFSSVFYALHQSGRVTELSHSASGRTVDGMQAVVWTSTSRQTGVSFQQGFIHLKHEMPYSSELGCLKKEGPTGTAEPFPWVGHLNYSLPYSGWYQAALYKCDPSLYKLRKPCKKKMAECWLLLLYYFGQNTHTSKGQRTLKSECSWWSL